MRADSGAELAAEPVHEAKRAPYFGLTGQVADLAAQIQSLLASIKCPLEVTQDSVKATDAPQACSFSLLVAQLVVQGQSVTGVAEALVSAPPQVGGQ